MNLRRIGLSLFVFIALGGVVQAASYMKLGDIKGEARDADKESEALEVIEFSITPTDTGSKEAEDNWEEPRGTTEPQGDGTTEHQDLSVTKELDKSSPKLQESCNGKDDDCDGVADDKAAYILCPDGTMIQPGEKCPETQDRAASIKIGDIKGESKDDEAPAEKAAYILCPDGTMIQPGEKCPEEDTAGITGGYTNIENLSGGTEPSSAGGNAEPTWKVEKASKDGAATGDHQDLAVTKEIDKATPKLQEEVCNGVDDDCDGPEAERRRGDTKLEDVTVVKEMDKSTPKFAESVTRSGEEDDIEALDVDSDNDGIPANHNTTRSNRTQPVDGGDPDDDGDDAPSANYNTTRSNELDPVDEKVSYILCPDGTMIQPGEKCPEEDREVLSHELAHVVQQSSGRINVENDTPVVVEEDEDGERTVEVSGVESRSVLGLFPVEVSVKVKLDESGNLVQVKRPWYSLFSW